jgi:prepilin-type N-terminal cleavage/methylation domain-containing protein
MTHKQNQAFTLMEMLTVIVIVGIITSIAIPSITGLIRGQNLSTSLRQLANHASLARQYAITHRTKTELRIAPDFTAFGVFTNGAPVGKWEYLPKGVVVSRYADPPGNTFRSDLHLVFTPTGAITSQYEGVIHVVEGHYDATTNVLTFHGTNNYGDVRVNQMIGKVKIVRP